MKKFYLAIQVCRNEKYYAFLMPVPDYQNVYAMLKDVPDIVCATIFSTKKAASETVDAWNVAFMSSGTFYYDDF